MAAPSWADLPRHCLDAVFDELEPEDEERARAACRGWSCATRKRFRLTSATGAALAFLEGAAAEGQLASLEVAMEREAAGRPYKVERLFASAASAARRSPKLRRLHFDGSAGLSCEDADAALGAMCAFLPALTHLRFVGAPCSDGLAVAMGGLPGLEELEVRLTCFRGYSMQQLYRYSLEDLRLHLECAEEPLRRLRSLTLALTYENLGEDEFQHYADAAFRGMWEDDDDLYRATLVEYGDEEVDWLVPLILEKFPVLTRLTLSCDSDSHLLRYLAVHPLMKERGVEVIPGLPHAG